jgi:hypothetical protein
MVLLHRRPVLWHDQVEAGGYGASGLWPLAAQSRLCQAGRGVQRVSYILSMQRGRLTDFRSWQCMLQLPCGCRRMAQRATGSRQRMSWRAFCESASKPRLAATFHPAARAVCKKHVHIIHFNGANKVTSSNSIACRACTWWRFLLTTMLQIGSCRCLAA